MNKIIIDRCKEYRKHIKALCGVDLFVLDINEYRLISLQKGEAAANETERITSVSVGSPFCECCGRCESTGIKTHLYGCYEAQRWGGKYIYYCPEGLVFVATPLLSEKGILEGGFIAGPVIMGELQDVLKQEDIVRGNIITKLPCFDTAKVNHLAEVLAAVTIFIVGSDYTKTNMGIHENDKILSYIHSLQEKYNTLVEGYVYPIETEKKLQEMIFKRDKPGSQALLNELLGHVYYSSNYDLNSIKARILELTVILSRASIDAGADINDIFWLSTVYIKELDEFTNIEDLSTWISGIMHRYVNFSFDFKEVKHSDVVFKVIEYVKVNYNKKLSLDDISKKVYLSKSYLSGLFKEETGESLSAFINRIRVEKSMVYLMDLSISLVEIANMCGFEDQSYYTKVFKKATGLSPKKFRDNRGKFFTKK